MYQKITINGKTFAFVQTKNGYGAILDGKVEYAAKDLATLLKNIRILEEESNGKTI